jgi:hypothetical protein
MSEETLINEVGYGGQEIDVDESGDFLDGKTLVTDSTGAGDANKKPDTGKNTDDEIDIDTGKTKGQKPEGSTEKQTDKAPADKGAQKISGFASRFMKQDAKGGSVFDADGAMAFIKPGDGKDASFRYELKPRKGQEKQTDGADGKPKEPVNPYKQRIEERKKFREEQQGNLYFWKNKYAEALKGGYEPAQALAYAEQQVKEHLDTREADWLYEQEAKFAEERGKGELTAKELADARQSRVVNEQAFVQKLGGYEQYNEFLFGKKGADGTIQKGYAADMVNMMFDIMNPDVDAVTPEAMDQWWDRFASDPARLQMVYEFALARLQREIFPHLMQKAVTVHKETERQKDMGKQRKAGDSNRSIAPDAGELPGDLAGFLRPPNTNEGTDTI